MRVGKNLSKIVLSSCPAKDEHVTGAISSHLNRSSSDLRITHVILRVTPSHLHISSYHVHIFASSHLHIFTFKDVIFTSSYLHTSSQLIFAFSHLYICTSHLHIFSSPYFHIFSSSYLLSLICCFLYLHIHSSSLPHFLLPGRCCMVCSTKPVQIFPADKKLLFFE